MAGSDKEYGPTAEGFPLRIPPGEYEAVCYKVENGTGWGYQRKLYFRFVIHGGRYNDADLFMACSYPKKISYRTKLYKQWMLALGKPPAKGQRFSHRVFLNRMFKNKVGDTERKHDDGKKLPNFAQYSVVKTILEPLTGGPPRE